MCFTFRTLQFLSSSFSTASNSGNGRWNFHLYLAARDIARLIPERCAHPMKSVSWRFAFRKLNEWREHRWFVTFGPVGDVDLQGEATRIFSGSSGTHVI